MLYQLPAPLPQFLIRTLLTLLLLWSAQFLSAQLVVNPGTTFSMAGNVQMTLQNTDFVNNGSFSAGTGQIIFTGNAGSSIRGEQPTQFFRLEIAKTGNSLVSLQQPIGVTQRLLFTSGLLDLNGFNTDLGSTGSLAGEHETSRITGASGGQVLCSAILNAPAAANPGNLGAIITSSKDLGTVTIRRGHEALNGSGMATSIGRFYDIAPANNTGLNATLRLSYFDTELNGIAEVGLGLFKSEDGINWTDIGSTTKDTTANFVEKTGLDSLSKWTLSTDGHNNLPVEFLSFDAACEGSGTRLTWITAQEANTSHFNIEKSEDGAHWTVIGAVTAAGNSTVREKYTYLDQQGAPTGYYRIAEVDLDGTMRYTRMVHSSCVAPDALSLWPNPIHDLLFVKIAATTSSKVIIRLFNPKGDLIREQEAFLSPGSNQFNLDLRSLAAGVYIANFLWDHGHFARTVQLMKD